MTECYFFFGYITIYLSILYFLCFTKKKIYKTLNFEYGACYEFIRQVDISFSVLFDMHWFHPYALSSFINKANDRLSCLLAGIYNDDHECFLFFFLRMMIEKERI